MDKKVREPGAFCPETAGITGEHLWSAWAGRMFEERRYTITSKEPDGRVLTWTLPELNAKTRVVCGDCNGGWMGDLENQVKPSIGEMIYNCTQTTLNAKDIAALAVWRTPRRLSPNTPICPGFPNHRSSRSPQ